jgi:hypothetical protein
MPSFISSIIRKQKVILTSGAVAVGTVLLLIAVQFLYLPLQQESLLSIAFRASQTGSVALYYDTGMQFQERESQSIIIQGDSTWHTFTFPLPNKKINALRFDPPAVKEAEFQIRDIRIINSQGKTLRRIEPEDVKPLHQIRHFERSDRIIQFQTDEISNDPQLLISPEHPITSPWYHVLRGTFLLWLLIAGLGTFIVFLLTFHTFRTEKTGNLRKTATFFVLTVLCLLGVWLLHAKVSSCFLEASIKTSSAEMAKLYFDTGQGLSEGQTAALWVNSIDSFGRYRFPLPPETIYHLRFDPPSTNGTVIINNVLVTDGLGRIIRYIPLHQLYPLHQIEKSILQGDHLAITSIRNATDPQIGIHLQNPLQIPTSLFWGDPLFLTLILALWAMPLLLFKVFKKRLYLVGLVRGMLSGGIPGRLIIGIYNGSQKIVDRFSRTERKNKTLWKFLLITGIFLGFFLFFFLRNHYYVPAKLHIEGFAQKPIAAVFQWDTGNGFNDYETTAFTIEQLPTPGLFVRELDLPQLGVYGIALKTKDSADRFSLHTLKIVSSNGEVKLPVNSGVVSNAFVYPRIDPQTAKFHWTLLTVQVFLAGLCTYFVILLFPHVRSRQQLHVTFLAGKRWLFWCMFFIASGIFSSWLIGYWPGALSYDPISYWLSAKLISIDRAYYPMPLYLLLLMQIYDSPAVVALFQILAVAGLGSYIFYFTYKNGVKFYLIVPFFAAFCFSIPIGIYNIGLYNDVPFAILISFWAFFLFLSNFHKKIQNTPIKLSIVKISILSLFFLLLCIIRASGLVFIVFVPFILWHFKLLESKSFYKFILISLLLFIINFGIKSTTTYRSTWSESYYHYWKIVDLSALIDNKSGYESDDFENDRKIIEKFVSVNEIKKHNLPANKMQIGQVAYNNFNKMSTSEANESISQLNILYIKRIFPNFHIFLSNRTYIFFASFGTFEAFPILNYDMFNILENRDIFLNWWAGNNVTNRKLAFSPKSKALHETLKKLLTISIRPECRLIIWNALPFLIVFSVILFLYKWFPMSSLYSSLILFQVFFLFLFLPGSDFRYVYFIYLSGIFIFPLFFLEIISKKRVRINSKTSLYMPPSSRQT